MFIFFVYSHTPSFAKQLFKLPGTNNKKHIIVTYASRMNLDENQNKLF